MIRLWAQSGSVLDPAKSLVMAMAKIGIRGIVLLVRVLIIRQLNLPGSGKAGGRL